MEPTQLWPRIKAWVRQQVIGKHPTIEASQQLPSITMTTPVNRDPHTGELHPPHARNPVRSTNLIRTSRYTAYNFLLNCGLKQFQHLSNVYFVVIFVLALVGNQTTLFDSPLPSEGFLLSLALVISFTMIFEGYYDIKRHREDRKTNNRTAERLRFGDGLIENVPWSSVVPGDVLKVRDRTQVPADMILLTTSTNDNKCYLETANIDGETNLKVKQVPPGFVEKCCAPEMASSLWAEFTYDAPNAFLKFSGTAKVMRDPDKDVPLDFDNLLLRGSVLRNTPWVLGMVMYAGPETKVFQSSNNPPIKQSRVMVLVNQMILVILLVGLLICIVSAIVSLSVTPDESFYYLFNTRSVPEDYSGPAFFSNVLTFVILYSNLVPIALLICVTTSNTIQAMFINWDLAMFDGTTGTPAKCNTLELVQELGQVSYLFSDKTGTLTRNEMKLVGVAVGGTIYGLGSANQESVKYSSDSISRIFSDLIAHMRGGGPNMSNIEEFLTIISVCHTVLVDQSTGEIKYNAEGPDEEALVEAASQLGFKLISTDNGVYTVEISFPKPAAPVEGGAISPTKSTEGHYDPLSNAINTVVEGNEMDDDDNATIIESEYSSDEEIVIPEQQPSTTEQQAQDDGNSSSGTRNVVTNNDRDTQLAATRESDPLSESHSGSVHESSDSSDDGSNSGEASNEIDRVANIDPELAAKNGVFSIDDIDENTPRDVVDSLLYGMEEGNECVEDVVEQFEPVVVQFEILAVNHFNSTRKRMSCVVRLPNGKLVLMCKGADSVMFERMDKEAHAPGQMEVLERNLDDFAKDGLRTLVIARRYLEMEDYMSWKAKYDQALLQLGDARDEQLTIAAQEIEKNLVIVGATAIEDRLQDKVRETLTSIKEAGVKVWVLTGDKVETAINIAFSAELLKPDMHVVEVKSNDPQANQDAIEELSKVITLENLDYNSRLRQDARRVEASETDPYGLIHSTRKAFDKAMNYLPIPQSHPLSASSKSSKKQAKESRDTEPMTDQTSESNPAEVESGANNLVLPQDQIPQSQHNPQQATSGDISALNLSQHSSSDASNVQQQQSDEVTSLQEPSKGTNSQLQSGNASDLQQSSEATNLQELERETIAQALNSDIDYNKALESHPNNKGMNQGPMERSLRSGGSFRWLPGYQHWLRGSERRKMKRIQAQQLKLMRLSQQVDQANRGSRSPLSHPWQYISGRLQPLADEPRGIPEHSVPNQTLDSIDQVEQGMLMQHTRTSPTVETLAGLNITTDGLPSPIPIRIHDPPQPLSVNVGSIDASTVSVEQLIPEDPLRAGSDGYMQHVDFSAQQESHHGLQSIQQDLQFFPQSMAQPWEQFTPTVQWANQYNASDSSTFATNMAVGSGQPSHRRVQSDPIMYGFQMEPAITTSHGLGHHRREATMMEADFDESGEDDDDIVGSEDDELEKEAECHKAATQQAPGGNSAPTLDTYVADNMALVISGKALEGLLQEENGTAESEEQLLRVARLCSVVLCCRVSPKQKALLVRMVKHGVKINGSEPVTMAIGDGANDVAMIQEARVGVGINGHEGAQAANSADFAIAQFRFLKRLMLVHGRWNYRRMATVVLFVFYSNVMFVFSQFYFNFYNKFSGSSLYFVFLLIFYSYPTNIPILFVGALNKDISASTALRYPAMYISGRQNLDLGMFKITEYIIKSVVHAIIICGFQISFCASLDVSLNVMGTSIFYNCVVVSLMQTLFEVFTWTRTMYFVIGAAGCAFLIAEPVYYNSDPSVFTLYGSSVLFGFAEPQAPRYIWSITVLSTVTCMCFGLLLTWLRRQYFPVLVDSVIELDRGVYTGVKHSQARKNYLNQALKRAAQPLKLPRRAISELLSTTSKIDIAPTFRSGFVFDSPALPVTSNNVVSNVTSLPFALFNPSSSDTDQRRPSRRRSSVGKIIGDFNPLSPRSRRSSTTTAAAANSEDASISNPVSPSSTVSVDEPSSTTSQGSRSRNPSAIARSLLPIGFVLGGILTNSLDDPTRSKLAARRANSRRRFSRTFSSPKNPSSSEKTASISASQPVPNESATRTDTELPPRPSEVDTTQVAGQDLAFSVPDINSADASQSMSDIGESSQAADDGQQQVSETIHDSMVEDPSIEEGTKKDNANAAGE